jgi:hypothetical protein
MLELDVSHQPATPPISLYQKPPPFQPNGLKKTLAPNQSIVSLTPASITASNFRNHARLAPVPRSRFHDTIERAPNQHAAPAPPAHCSRPSARASNVTFRALLAATRFPARLSRRRSAARSTRPLSEYVTRRPDGLNACRLAGSALEISEQRIVSCFPPAPCTQPCPSASLFPRAFAATDPPALVWTRFSRRLLLLSFYRGGSPYVKLRAC